MFFIKGMAVLFFALLLLGCKGIQDDLMPQGKDNRPTTAADQVPLSNLHVVDTAGADVDLLQVAASKRAVVLYFTMWCPVCNSHTDHMRANIIPNYPNVAFFLVDYLSATVSEAKNNQDSSGYTGIPTLVDLDNLLENTLSGTMAITVVIDPKGYKRMQEDYKDGSRLQQTLNAL